MSASVNEFLNHSVLFKMALARYTTEQCAWQKMSAFPGEPVPRIQNVHYLVNELKTIDNTGRDKRDYTGTDLC
jgi:hypothetical protein